MTVTFTTTPELDLARVAIRAEGGVVGDSFYVLRRDRSGSNMVRETSQAGVTWQADPAATKTNQHTNPRWASVSGVTELRRNLATNPRCAPGSTATERRRNLVPQGSSDVLSHSADYNGGAGNITQRTDGGASGANYARQTWTTASSSAGGGTFLSGGIGGILEGRIYYVQASVRTSIAQQVKLGVDWRTSGGTLFSLGTVAVASVPAYNANATDGQAFTKIEGFIIAPVTAANGTITIFANPTGSVWPVNSWLDTDSVFMELIDTTKKPYRVNRVTNPSFEAGIAGTTAGASTLVSDSTWANFGTRSLKITGNGNNDSYASMEGDVGGMRLGFYSGGTFTISGYFRQTAVQPATIHATRARSIVLFHKQAGAYTEVLATATNTIGAQRVSMTVTLPAGTTEAFIRLYNGTTSTTHSVWWDDIQVEDGSVLTNVLNGAVTATGDTQIRWMGTPGASPSIEAPANIEYFDGGTGVISNNGGEDLIASWTGTAGNSQSILTSRNVPLYAQVNSSVFAAKTGTALAIVPNGVSQETYAAIEADGGALRLGMVANKTYTVRARCTVVRPQTNQTGTGRARKIVTFSRVGAGSYTETSSAAAPNATGDYDLSVTFTTVAGATDAFIRLYNGSNEPNDVVIWSKIQVMEKDGAYFDGSTPNTADLSYTWTGAVDASATTMSGKVPVGSNANAAVIWSSTDKAPTGAANFARFEVHAVGAQGFNAVDLPAAGTSPSGPKTFLAIVRASKNLTVQPRWRNAVGSTSNAGPTVNLVAGVWTLVRHYWPTAPADSGVSFLAVPGTNMAVGDTFDIGPHAVINGDWTGGFFDGSSYDPAINGWNGAANASTSYYNTAALPITIYDYEARQGQETSYALTSDMGIVGEFQTISIPKWGTWLKDPHRPFMNCKVLWNSDSVYTRKSDRVLLKPRGGRYPVPLWDQREAPEGTVRVATETNEESRALVALLDDAGVIMIDVDEDFGVPVRYVSVGDYSGQRVGDADRNLTWEARYFDLPVTEVDVPVGEPIGQEISYDSMSNYFGSYLALAATVNSYDELAAGTWATNA